MLGERPRRIAVGGALLLVVANGLLACSGERAGFATDKDKPDADTALDSNGVGVDADGGKGGSETSTMEESTDVSNSMGESSSTDPADSSNSDLSGESDASDTDTASDECMPKQERPCSGSKQLGACADGVETCAADGSGWSDCSIEPSPDTCEPGNDADCDGKPNEGCDCASADERPCEGALGACATGIELCEAGTWGECNVLPAEADACDVAGDDSDCDGLPNGGCMCTSEDTQACGSETDEGACAIGTSTCVDSEWGECIGAVAPAARDCTSSDDNDCDGEPDNTLDETCECTPDMVEACEEHPEQDGNGVCQAGERQCTAAPGNASSSWGECVGSKGPSARDCASTADNDCDGQPDNTIDVACTCEVGAPQDCGAEAGSNGCRLGTQECEAGDDGATSAWGDCEYADAPDDTQCDDGDAASTNDTCNDGVCLGEYDETPPTVQTFAPAAEASAIETNSVIEVTFSEAIDPATVTVSSFIVSGPEGTIAGALSFPSATQVRFTPTAKLGLLREYSVSITTVVKDLAGNALAQARTASFTTRDGTWGTPVLLETDDVESASLAQLAVSSGGNATVIWKYGDVNGGALKARRYVAGSWATVDTLEATEVFSTRVGIDGNGNGLAVWAVSGSTLYWRSFTSSGWGTRTSLTTGLGIANLGFAMDSGGHALLNWINATDDYQVVSSYYSGSSWSSPVDFPEAIQSSYVIEVTEREVLFGSDGQALATWWEWGGGGPEGWLTKTTRYNPTTGWASTSGYVGAEYNSHIKLAGDPATTAVAVWAEGNDIYANRYTSNAWGTRDTLETASGAAGQSHVAMAPSGEGIAVWSQTDGTRYNIYHRRFSGGAWIGTASTIEALNTDAYNPQVAMDVAGNGFALWEQGATTSIYAARFNASAATWSGGSSPIESGSGAAGQIRVGVDGFGRAVAVWTQNNSAGTRTDIYYSYFQ